MSEKIETLGDALPKEIERVQKLIPIYESIGPGGMPAAMMMRAEVAAAKTAMVIGDTVAMIRLYHSLEGWIDLNPA